MNRDGLDIGGHFKLSIKLGTIFSCSQKPKRLRNDFEFPHKYLAEEKDDLPERLRQTSVEIYMNAGITCT